MALYTHVFIEGHAHAQIIFLEFAITSDGAIAQFVPQLMSRQSVTKLQISFNIKIYQHCIISISISMFSLELGMSLSNRTASPCPMSICAADWYDEIKFEFSRIRFVDYSRRVWYLYSVNPFAYTYMYANNNGNGNGN